MKTYHVFRCSDDPELAELQPAIRRARFGQIEEAVRADLYCHAGRFQSDGGIDDVAQDFGDVAVDIEAGDALVRSPFGWQALSWPRGEKFLHQAFGLEKLASRNDATIVAP